MAIRRRAVAPSDTNASGKETSAEAVKGADAVKTTVKSTVKTTAAKKTTAKKTGDKETTAKKTADKETAAKKTNAKKAASKKETFIVQFRGREVSKETIEHRFQDVWTKDFGRKIGEVKSVAFYVKPEDSAVYFVVNGDEEERGSFPI